jgi:hypothetical protein
VDSGKFLPLESPVGPWVMRVILIGEDFETRAAPLVAKVGELDVDFMQISADGTTASGLLAEIPPSGARVRIGYLDDPELADTEVTFQPA